MVPEVRYFRKRPVTVQAIKYDPPRNCDEVAAFLGRDDAEPCYGCDGTVGYEFQTPEGWVSADPGDWIIRVKAGEFHRCKPAFFWATYEEVPRGPS